MCASTIVAISNCAIMKYICRKCDVSPCSNEYKRVANVPINQAATVLQASNTGKVYILIYNKDLWIGGKLYHSFIILNQLRHFGITGQDNHMCDQPL